MNNVLPFGKKTRSSLCENTQDVLDLSTLTDSAADFSNGIVDQPSGSLSYLPNKTAVTPDWANQEIASFMRAHRLLSIAGLSLETERGVTDEGDPWFVFANQDGDVFAHFARIGKVYILDSTIQQEIAKAGSLDELISAFAETTTPVDSADHLNICRSCSLRRLARIKSPSTPGRNLGGSCLDNLYPVRRTCGPII
mmetsp:Transcript_2976/g.3591  ORF Transcript_2976/g.3591 Transcript_2976/m.3591 type:complete len:196 (-) Transcript_2976:54-641(-)